MSLKSGSAAQSRGEIKFSEDKKVSPSLLWYDSIYYDLIVVYAITETEVTC